MKIFKLFSLMIASLAILESCSSSEEPLENCLTQEEMIPVSIGFSGEVLDITETPLSRGENVKDWYAFQVYSAPLDGSNDYTYYAYGFFDNKEDMVINLKEGYKYKFDVCMVVDGENKVYSFSLTELGWKQPDNTFYISPTEHVRYMYEGYLYLKNPFNTFNRPNVDRFFGRVVDFIPKKNQSVNINMKRTAFCAKFKAKKFTEGKLEISIEGAPLLTLDAAQGTEIEDYFSFNNLEAAYTNFGNYSEEIPVNIVWVKPDNRRVPIANEVVNFKRNKVIQINFEIKEPTTENGFVLDSSEAIEAGDDVTIGGDGDNVDVDPH